MIHNKMVHTSTGNPVVHCPKCHRMCILMSKSNDKAFYECEVCKEQVVVKYIGVGK